MPKFDKNAEPPAYELLDGDYPFEIVKVEERISTGPKTSGSAVRDVTMDFYKDDTFAEKISTIKDSLIDHPSCDWKFSVMAKAVRFPVQPGEAFDIDGGWRGYRGWAHCSPEPDRQDPKKKWNRVRAYLADRKAIAPRVIAEDDVPF